jgi:hypothetical protein
MNRTLTIALAVVSGLLGGLLTRYIAPPAAYAQNSASSPKEIRAQSFTLVDPAGRVLGTFVPEPRLGFAIGAVGPVPGRILLLDSNGREIWSAGGSPFRAPSER